MWRAPEGLDAALGAVAGRVLPRADLRPGSVAPDVRALSDLYNGLDAPRLEPDRRLAAELLFFLPADLGKVPACLSELAAAGRLPRGRTLRVLDLGAGPGTASLGARLALGDRCNAIEVVAVDRDARTLETGRILHEEVGRTLGKRAVPVEYRALARELASGSVPDGTFDLVIAQGLLSELPEEAHERLVRAALGALSPHGALVVIEPALRTAARALHHLRDAVLADGKARAFAPCVRRGPCPALDRRVDWCHEDRAWSPSARVADLARRAGLRRAGLKFAYVTFLADEASVAATFPGTGEPYRVVSALLESKGKVEAFLCGEAGRLRVCLLKRDRSPSNEVFRRLRRGDLVRIEARLDPSRPRIDARTRVTHRRAEQESRPVSRSGRSRP